MIMNNLKTKFLLIFCILFARECQMLQGETIPSAKTFHYYCTCADSVHFPLLLNLIGSIHKVDFDSLDQIAVFDLGLKVEQREVLENIEKVKIYEIEKKHPDILQYFQTNSQKKVRGWYAWKPVAMKQALDLFPYFLYLDAGSLVLNSTSQLFNYIQQEGYFVISVSHNIVDRITKPVMEKIVLKLPIDQQRIILDKDTMMIAGGVQGISHKIRESYILPIYNLASDLSFFADDGSAKMGFGAGRHDQTLFSIYGNLLKFQVHNGEGYSELFIQENKIPFHYHWNQNKINEQTCIYSCRWDDNSLTKKQASFIHWRKKEVEAVQYDKH